LYEWIHSEETGMDNTPRFDKTSNLDGIDLNSFIVNELEYLALIATEIGNNTDAKTFTGQKIVLADKINSFLWDKEDNFYYDKTLTGEFIKTKAVSGFLPLFAGIADKAKEEILYKQVMDTTQWLTAFPFPSLPLKDKAFNSNMWRGPTWINYSYFIYRGLKRYNHPVAAREVAERVILQISDYYNQSGSIYEYYDPLVKTHPDLLPRKKVIGALHEYGWSAALYICFVNE
jgi:neutral trehalase